jgi:hypothetical protein
LQKHNPTKHAQAAPVFQGTIAKTTPANCMVPLVPPAPKDSRLSKHASRALNAFLECAERHWQMVNSALVIGAATAATNIWANAPQVFPTQHLARRVASKSVARKGFLANSLFKPMEHLGLAFVWLQQPLATGVSRQVLRQHPVHPASNAPPLMEASFHSRKADAHYWPPELAAAISIAQQVKAVDQRVAAARLPLWWAIVQRSLVHRVQRANSWVI